MTNDPIDLIDPIGLDFIAAGVRPAKAALGLQNHMSIEFYEEKPPCAIKGYKFTSSDVGKAPLENAKLTDQFELIPTLSDYEHQYSKTVFNTTINWSTPAWVGFIYRTSTAKELVVIYDDSIGDAATQWKKIVVEALDYEYAEQEPIGNPLKNWPNSKYQLPPGNNSNTFIHEMASLIGANADVFLFAPAPKLFLPIPAVSDIINSYLVYRRSYLVTKYEIRDTRYDNIFKESKCPVPTAHPVLPSG